MINEMREWNEEIKKRLASLRLAPTREAEIVEELAQHLDDRYAEFVAGGSTLIEARRRALEELSDSQLLAEELRRAERPIRVEPVVWGARRESLMRDLWQDLRYGWRVLSKHMGFTLTAAFTLALGIGASTAIFSAVKPILLDSLPYPDAGQLTMIWDHGPDASRQDVTFGTYRELVERSRSYHGMAVMRYWQPTMTGPDEPERLVGQRVSAGYFRVLGFPPAIGRDFDSSDDRTGGPRVVILSDKLWQRRFDRDSTIIGDVITLDDSTYTVIGVMPSTFENVVAPSAQLWTLLQYDAAVPLQGREWGHHLRMLGRMRPGTATEQAKEELDKIAQAPAQEFPRPPWASLKHGLIVNSLQDDITGAVKPSLLAVLGAVSLVLLIACVNVTNLLIARNAQRRGEFAVRAALGAGRLRMIRQLLAESLLLAVLGGALGMVAAEFGVRALVALAPDGLPRIGSVRLDGTIFAFGLGITTLVGLAVGLIPALNLSRVDLYGAIQKSSWRIPRGHHLTRRVLVVAQVALALVLLVSAGLLLRSLERLFAVDPGFNTSHLLTMQVQTSGHRFDRVTTQRFFAEVLEAVREVPGVTTAALTSQLPLSGDVDEYGVHFEPRPDDKPEGGYSVYRYAVSPGYFEATGIPIRGGRPLDERDAAGAPLAVVISESLAGRKFPGGDPIGQRLRIGPIDGPLYTIVGVAGDVRQVSLAVSQTDAVYVTLTQWHGSDRAMSLVARSRGEGLGLVPAIRKAVWSIEKDQPVVRVASMDDLLAATATERRFVLLIFETFGVIALVLAATGIYGVLSGGVSERIREFGVRMALGANPRDILRLVLRQGLTPVAIGIALGLIAAGAATQPLQSLLFGISPRDPFTFVGIALLLAVIALVACWLPARSAAKVDPMVALREE